MKSLLNLSLLLLILSSTASLSSATPLPASDSVPSSRWQHPRWRQEQIAQDLLRGDSLEAENVRNLKYATYWKNVAQARLKKNRQYLGVVKALRVQLAVEKRQHQEAVIHSEYWEGQAGKYKRQRNGIIIGAGVVVVAAGAVYVIELLKR